MDPKLFSHSMDFLALSNEKLLTLAKLRKEKHQLDGEFDK